MRIETVPSGRTDLALGTRERSLNCTAVRRKCSRIRQDAQLIIDVERELSSALRQASRPARSVRLTTRPSVAPDSPHW